MVHFARIVSPGHWYWIGRSGVAGLRLLEGW
jgi:hypothetical protein